MLHCVMRVYVCLGVGKGVFVGVCIHHSGIR